MMHGTAFGLHGTRNIRPVAMRPVVIRPVAIRPVDIRPVGRLAALLVLAWAVALTLLVAIAPANAQAPAVARDGYVLGPSDSISVIVYGNNEFNVQTRIKPDGSIVMPLVGRIQASGKDVIQLADEVARRLQNGNFLRDPIVNVEVLQYNSRYARVVGRVGSPGLVPLDRAYGLLDVLLRSGWVRDDGSKFVVLRRGGDGKEIRINTERLVLGQEGADIIVQPGDTIFVDVAELVYLIGAVNRPGGYPIEPGMTVGQLIARAGGVGPTGAANRFRLKRDGRESDVDDRFELKAEDVITVRERLF